MRFVHFWFLIAVSHHYSIAKAETEAEQSSSQITALVAPQQFCTINQAESESAFEQTCLSSFSQPWTDQNISCQRNFQNDQSMEMQSLQTPCAFYGGVLSLLRAALDECQRLNLCRAHASWKQRAFSEKTAQISQKNSLWRQLMGMECLGTTSTPLASTTAQKPESQVEQRIWGKREQRQVWRDGQRQRAWLDTSHDSSPSIAEFRDKWERIIRQWAIPTVAQAFEAKAARAPIRSPDGIASYAGARCKGESPDSFTLR